MATSNQFNGGLVGLYIDGTLIGCTTSDSFNGEANSIDASCKGSSLWGYSLQGTKNWNFSTEGRWIFDAAYGAGDIIDLWINGTEVVAKLSTDESGDWYIYGNCVCTSVSLTAPNNEASGFAATFNGRGPLNKVTLT